MNALRRRAPRCARWFALLLLALPTAALLAQDLTPEATPLEAVEAALTSEAGAEATSAPEIMGIAATDGIAAAGSGILAPLVQRSADTAGIAITVTVNGSTRGLAALCSNSADFALTTRALSSDEEAACSTSGVGFGELLVGYDIVTFIVDASSSVAQCITTAQLNTLFAPSSAGQITDWQQINPLEAATPLTVIVPPTNAPGFAQLDALIEGDAFRDDASALAGTDAINALTGSAGAVAAVPLTVAASAGDSVRVLDVDSGTGCTAPSTENVASGAYTTASPLVVYVNTASLAKPGLRELLTALTTDTAESRLTDASFNAPSAAEREATAAALADGRSGRVFSRTNTTYSIAPTVAGAVNIGGAASGFTFMQAATTAFNAQYPGVTITTTTDGQTAGFRRLCNGEVDAVFAHGALADEAVAACAAANITPEQYTLGSQVAVLVANSASEYLQCVTTTDLATAWRASSANTVTTWNAVNAAFPEAALTLFAPAQGSVTTDILMLALTGGDDPSRADIQLDDDASYRAAAVANVEGGMALLSWDEYQAILTAGQERVSAVAVDAGSGCVAPSLTTITDATYTLARPVSLIVSRAALARPEVQGVLWYLAQDAQLAQFSTAGFVGLTPDTLADRRAALETTFTEVTLEAAAAAQAAAEATPSAEATGEAGAEATVEATAATGEAGAEVTAEATAP